jgi:glycosyltransferase involved in cell wall biosynthesis
MACGTPVVAFRCGSVPEVIDHGVSGFIVDSLDAAVRAVRDCGQLDRSRVRQCFERRFAAERMARDYIALYRQLAGIEAAKLLPMQIASPLVGALA